MSDEKNDKKKNLCIFCSIMFNKDDLFLYSFSHHQTASAELFQSKNEKKKTAETNYKNF